MQYTLWLGCMSDTALSRRARPSLRIIVRYLEIFRI